ncbi:Non-specific serine/threonine protein kinase [Bertholletia excelsa]
MSHGGEIAYNAVMAALSFILTLLLVMLFFLFCKKKPMVGSQEIKPTKLSCASAYSLMDIDAATDGFNHRRIIGQGRLGTVYAGVLPRGEMVAVKKIHPRLVLSNAGFGFSSMIKRLSLARHPNIVSILGLSEAPGERIVIMEFLGVMSLDYYLHQNSDGPSFLDWSRRVRVAAVAAPSIVHGSIKPSNILIDFQFCARVCDYGLSFLAPQEREGLKGGVSKECDVYGLGVVLLELLSGRSSEDGLLVNWALPLIKDMNFSELLDPRLVIPSNLKPLVRLAKVAAACVGNSRKNRPSIVQVAAILNNLEMDLCL